MKYVISELVKKDRVDCLVPKTEDVQVVANEPKVNLKKIKDKQAQWVK